MSGVDLKVGAVGEPSRRRKYHRTIPILPALVAVALIMFPGVGSARAAVSGAPVPGGAGFHSGAAPGSPPPAYRFVRMWGAAAPAGTFNSPVGITTDAKGDIFVADMINDRVEKFDKTGTLLWQQGSVGHGLGQFWLPQGVAVDANGYVFVADAFNNRVQVLSPDGFPVAAWGGPGTSLGQFQLPGGVAVVSSPDTPWWDDTVYVADTANDRVQEFTGDGSPIRAWDGSGSGGAGQFSSPYGVAVDDTSGTVDVLVADSGNNQVQEFTGNGSFIQAIGSAGTDNGQFNFPLEVAADPAGNVFVTDFFNNRVQEFAPQPDGTLTFVRAWGSLGAGEGQFINSSGVAVDGRDVYVGDYTNSRVEKFTDQGEFIQQIGGPAANPGHFGIPQGAAVDAGGNHVFIADTNNNRIQEFTQTGQIVRTWGHFGSGKGELFGPICLAVDAAGNVFVADAGNNRIEEFNSLGQFVTSWGGLGSGEGQFDGPFGVAVDRSRHVFVVDQFNNRVEEFTHDGKFIQQWGTVGSGPGQFNAPEGVAVDGTGNVFVADWGNDRVEKFTNTGTFVGEWGSAGAGNGQFEEPGDVAVDATTGDVVVTDTGDELSEADADNNRVEEFTNDGTFISTIGGYGLGDGQFNGVYGIAVDRSGKLFVSDGFNNRIQEFAL